MGTCDYCGQGIATVMRIESSDGRSFGVGCDCVAKLDRDDNRLADEATRVRAEVRRQQRQDRAEKRRQERAAKREAELQEQRERNGGLTDREVETAKAEAEQKRSAEINTSNNQWLIDVLNQVPYTSDFVSSMIRQLKQKPLADMSPKCQDILCDIYAKTSTKGARRNSKAYNAATAEFESRL